MRLAQILRLLHLDQAAPGPLDVDPGRSVTVQFLGRRFRRNDELDMAVVKLVHQPGETPRALCHPRPKPAHTRQQDRMVTPRELDVVSGPAWPLAKLLELEPGGARSEAQGPNGPSLDLERDVVLPVLTGY